MNSAFRFEDEKVLIGLAVIPLLLVLYLITKRYQKRQLQKWGDQILLNRLMPDFSSTRTFMKFMIWVLAFGIMVLALARPQFGTKLSEVKRKGIEMILALDVSNSMMAEDIQPNRLENAKMAISMLVDRLENDKIGLIVFAGDAYIQMPVTTDYMAAKLFLSSINTQIVPKQGTAIGSAIHLAMRSFTLNSDKSRAIVIITDGENHEEGAVEAAKEAADAGIIIHTIGIGSSQGVPIPVTSASGQKDYRTDYEGKVIISKLNEDLLRQVAAAGGGTYVRATASRTGLTTILDEMNKMEKQEIQMKVYSEYDEQFVYYAGFALFLLLIDFILNSRKNKWLQSKMKNLFICLIFLSLAFQLKAQPGRGDIRQGNRYFKNEKFDNAELAYRKALEEKKVNKLAEFNLGDALYRQKKYEEAGHQFEAAASNEIVKTNSAKAYHNLGNSLLQAGKIEESINAYKDALRRNPGDLDTKYNLCYAQHMKKQQDQQKQQNGDKNDKNDKNNDKKDQQQQSNTQNVKISKEDAKRLLEALATDEKKVQEKVKKEKANASKVRTIKDW